MNQNTKLQKRITKIWNCLLL